MRVCARQALQGEYGVLRVTRHDFTAAGNLFFIFPDPGNWNCRNAILGGELKERIKKGFRIQDSAFPIQASRAAGTDSKRIAPPGWDSGNGKRAAAFRGG